MGFDDNNSQDEELELIRDLVIRGKKKTTGTPTAGEVPESSAPDQPAPGEEAEAKSAADDETAAEAVSAAEKGTDEAVPAPASDRSIRKSAGALWAGMTDRKRLILVVCAVLILVLLILLICLGTRAFRERRLMEASTAAYSDGETILPNVWIGDVNVSGMTREEAAAAVRKTAEDTLVHTLTVHLPDQELVFTTELHNLDADISAAVDAACSYGREDPSLRGLYEAVEASSDREERIPFATEVTWDSDYIRQQLDDIAREADAEPVENTVDASTEDHCITITKGAAGRELDTDTLMEQIEHAFSTADYADIDFTYTDLPIEEVPLTELYQTYTVEAVSAEYDPDTDSVTDSSSGYEPDVPVWKARYELEHADQGDVITLTFHEVEPEMSSEQLSSMLFRDTLASYGSVYASNANRTENLRLACAAIDGTVVQPGEVFSFNDTVGERTTAKGYKSAIVYISGDSVPQTGGGICQVASTIYYCCLNAELEIVAREPHMYKVTYVPYGMDATVYWGSLDFQFRNSTDYPIRINACLSGGRCCIELIGTDVDHHQVELESVALSSLKYEVYRYVYDEDGTLLKKEDLGTSVYSKHKS